MVVILSSKSLKKDRMYTYLHINSIFNSICCSITIIDYIVLYYTIDIDDKKISYQYYNLILIKIIGSSIKTCSNISHLSFSLSRYKKIKGKDYIFIKSFNNLSFKLYLFLIIIFSMAINLYVYFQHEIISLGSDDKASVRFLNNYVVLPFNDYKVNFSDTEFIVLNVFQCLKILFSDLSYIIATTIIDIFLFKIVKKQMDKKRKILLNLNQNRTAAATTTTNNKKKENKISAEYRISRMIILNGINYFVFRFPFAIVKFYVLIFRHDEKEKKFLPNFISYLMCKNYKLCQNMGELFYFLFLVSYFIQFFIFFKLDKNFKDSLLAIITKIKNVFILYKNRILNRQ